MVVQMGWPTLSPHKVRLAHVRTVKTILARVRHVVVVCMVRKNCMLGKMLVRDGSWRRRVLDLKR